MMLQRVSSISTTIESSSRRLPPGEVTTRDVIGRRAECQLSRVPFSEGHASACPGHAEARPSALPREDDVFFCPGVDLLTMRAGQLVILERRVRVKIFIDR